MTAVHDDPHAAETQPVARNVLTAVLAEYDTPAAVTLAARKARLAGYTRIDAHTPFPFHELDEALAVGKTSLPWISLGAAATGGALALLMQWWMNAVDYKFDISGKPIFSVPSDMPVIFACCILFASIATLIGMLLLNGLPRVANPLLKSERFRRSTNDRFFLVIDARDPLFKLDAVLSLLHETHPVAVEECWVDLAERNIPKLVYLGVVLTVVFLCVPPSVIALMRSTDSRVPRFHLIQDMDFQPKFKAQSQNAFFDDNRAARAAIPGTVARGHLQDNDPLYRGLEQGSPSLQELLPAPVATPATPVAAATPATPDGAAPAAALDPLEKLPWVAKFPVPVTAETMKRGQERFNIYCSTCHGLAGDGDGLITLRALELEQGTWVKPVSFHTDAVRNQPVGRLFNTITNGVRKMPPLGDLIPAEDRWAILLYLRALQRSRNATLNDVPADLIPQLQNQ